MSTIPATDDDGSPPPMLSASNSADSSSSCPSPTTASPIIPSGDISASQLPLHARILEEAFKYIPHPLNASSIPSTPPTPPTPLHHVDVAEFLVAPPSVDSNTQSYPSLTISNPKESLSLSLPSAEIQEFETRQTVSTPIVSTIYDYLPNNKCRTKRENRPICVRCKKSKVGHFSSFPRPRCFLQPKPCLVGSVYVFTWYDQVLKLQGRQEMLPPQYSLVRPFLSSTSSHLR